MKDQSTELQRAKKKVGNQESKLNKAKLALSATDQLKSDLAATKKAQATTYATAIQA